MKEYQKMFRLASILLHYPERNWLDDPDLPLVIQSLDNRIAREQYLRFYEYLKQTPFEELCETYVHTFDLSDKATLYLTYNIFGENQERGPAFVKLREEFAEAGYPLLNDELPDFLPVVLEFASIAKEEDVQKVLLIHKRAIDRLLAELESANNPYAWIMQGCVHAIDVFLQERKAS